jgi:hypothetical protein
MYKKYIQQQNKWLIFIQKILVLKTIKNKFNDGPQINNLSFNKKLIL